MRGLQSPQILRDLFAVPCLMLHRIAFPVVSEWCQTMSGILALALQRFLAPLLVSPPKQAQHSIVDRFELNCGQPWAYVGCHGRR